MNNFIISSVAATHKGFSLAEILNIDPLYIATTILILVYVVLIYDRINTSVVAMLGASLMVLLGVINQKTAINGIDFNTLALLIGMMIIVSITSKSGLFQYVAIKSAKIVRASPMGILIILTLITAVFSAMLDNVTTVLLIGPITLLITDALKIKVFPFFFAEIIASNIGGTATLIGDPPNIIIGSAANLSFNQFLENLAPISIISMIFLLVIIFFLFKKSIKVSLKSRARVMRFNEKKAITDKPLMIKSLSVLFLVLLGFTIGHSHGIEPGTSALSGAGLLFLIAYRKQKLDKQNETIHKIFGEVEWVTIFFFAGLFIIVTGVEQTGLLKIFGKKMLDLTKGDLMWTTLLILWVSGVSSSFINNIPFVATMIPLIESTKEQFGSDAAIEPLWWALALGACFGGNGSLIGASANLTIAAYAGKAGQPITFMKFLAYAFPIMILTLVIASIGLWLMFFR